MVACDTDAMKEGVNNSKCVIAVINGGVIKEQRYLQRGACIAEIKWAIEAGKSIVPIVDPLDKPMVKTWPQTHAYPYPHPKPHLDPQP